MKNSQLERKCKSHRNGDLNKAWISSLRYSRHLPTAKAVSYWNVEIRAASENSRHIWRIVDNLLGDTKSDYAPYFSAEEYYDMLDKKVADITAAMASAADPTYVEHRVPVMIIWNQWVYLMSRRSLSCRQSINVAPIPFQYGCWRNALRHCSHLSPRSSINQFRQELFRPFRNTPLWHLVLKKLDWMRIFHRIFVWCSIYRSCRSF